MAFGTFTLTADTDPAHLFYFTDVTNAKQLKERLQAGDDRLAYAFIDGRSILSQFHLLVAARRAVEALRDQRLKTHNVHSEIVYNLAPDTNIGNALRHFGIAEDTKAMAVIKISKASREVIEADLVTLIQGTATHIDRIGADVDLQRIRKYYKLTRDELQQEREELVNTVVTAMALKGLTQAAITAAEN